MTLTNEVIDMNTHSSTPRPRSTEAHGKRPSFVAPQLERLGLLPNVTNGTFTFTVNGAS